jgi:hypothetical protein
MLTLDEFTQKLFGCMSFGLSEREARAIVDQGRATADYFERTALACFYPQYKDSGLPIDEWAILQPNVILSKYADKAENKAALMAAMG